MKKILAPATAVGIALIGPQFEYHLDDMSRAVAFRPVTTTRLSDWDSESDAIRPVEMPTRGPIGNVSRGFIETTLKGI